MALYRWICRNCKQTLRKLLDSVPNESIACKSCGNPLELQNSSQTMVMEVLDNGAMVKSLERLVNAEELTKEHSTHDTIKDADDTKLSKFQGS